MSGRFVTYRNKAVFYANRCGEASGEADYGVWHIDDLGIEGDVNGESQSASSEIQVGGESFTVLNAASAGRYTVSVVENTGDVYAWRTDEGAVALLGNMGGGEGCYGRADEPLEGWLGEPGGILGRRLSWFVPRLAENSV